MKHGKLIIIRGHSGSGKTTFAKQKIQEWKELHPEVTDDEICWQENDMYMVNEEGEYTFTFELARKAKQIVCSNLLRAVKYSKEKNYPLIVYSVVTNSSIKFYQDLIKQASKNGLEVEVYRMMNFYQDVHNVPENNKISQYLSLEANPLPGEIKVGGVVESSGLYQKIQKVLAFNHSELKRDEVSNSYVTQEYLENTEHTGHWIKKQSKRYPELFVYKYANRVFYDNLWDDALLEMRGLVLDQFGNIIIRPFNKCFNLTERLDRNSKYPLSVNELKGKLFILTRKMNGFLGVVTYVKLNEDHPSYHSSFNNKILYSTTGSLDSQYSNWVEREVEKRPNVKKLVMDHPNISFMFEVCIPEDPHVINEKSGLYLIGARFVEDGYTMGETALDQFAEKYDIERVYSQPKPVDYNELLDILKTCKHEGFMVHDEWGTELFFKVKSQFYLISKFLGRCTEKNIHSKLNHENFEEEFYPIIDFIKYKYGVGKFFKLEEQERIEVIQKEIEKLYEGK